MIHGLKVLALLLEVLSVVIMPLGDFDIEDIVVKIFDVL